jgi:signal transduction histidine kinase
MPAWRPVHAFLAKLVLVCLAYFAAGRLGLAVPFTNVNISPIWPPAGIAVACILIFGYRIWPAIFVGAFFTNFFSSIPHVAALGIATGSTLATLAAAFLLKRADFHPQLNRLRDVLSLLWAGSLGTLVSASVGVATLYAAHLRAWSSPESAWLVWWLGDLLGIVLAAPLVLSLQNIRARYNKKSVAEFAVLVVTLAAAVVLVFDNRVAVPTKDQMAAFLLFPFIIWAAVRLGLNAVAVAVNVVALISIWETARTSGPFVGNSPQQNAEMLQFFIAGLSITGLVLSAVIKERDEVQGALEAQKALREAQETLRQHEKLMMESEKLATTGRMAATLAHEINNPLEAVTNFLYLLRSDQGLSEQSRMFLKKADEELRRVAHMTRHTLAFHKGSAKPTEFELQSVCEEVISLIRPRFASKGLRLQETYANGAKITAIESETRQVISNLILNATQAAPAESTVTVIIDRPMAGVVRFAVEDCGSGIAEENESRLFEPFFTTKDVGTGLGLWVSKDILRRNGGDLKLENRKNPTRFSASFKSNSNFARAQVG